MRATKPSMVLSAADSQIVRTVYEKGVLRPLRPLMLKEHSQVDVAILSKADWAKTFRKLLQAVHARPSRLRAPEIEDEITRAREEVRRLRRRRRPS